ncbi:NmrA-like family domain-containing protein 1 [Trametes pubescens]|uniref:NmrA-like family domain-containing protein 1 n=1 Tax=Trametes pubescens TaxID=154538 RepID=A0A1M2VUT3_TRAPU|nr:NmrA-like family domain-containing protein 1 [Trametes pubescens]
MLTSKKIILVIGATGVQGGAVIDALLQPLADGSPSPYTIRALTRDPQSQRAKELASRGIEVVKGSTNDLDTVAAALEGVYGAYVNTDSFTIGEQKETFCGIRIFELAKQVKTVRHYVWSGADNVNKKTNYDPQYAPAHYTGKARVGDWMRAQPSVVSDDNMSWTILSTAPYMDMLQTGIYGPLRVRPDGTYVFASPFGQGHVPMITLADLGCFARYIFDHRAETSAQELEAASDVVSWDELVATFTKVTGKKAVNLALSIEEWFALFNQEDVARPAAPDTTTTFKETYSRIARLYRDDIITRDLAWIRRVHPGVRTVESWMRENAYTGDLRREAPQAGRRPRPNFERIAQL